MQARHTLQRLVSRSAPFIRPTGVLLIVLLVATASPAWAALAHGEAIVRDRGEPSAVPAAAAPATPVVGVWQRRDVWLWVYANGTARLRWRTDWCEPGAPTPCDQLDGRGLSLGAFAEMSLPDVPDTPHTSVSGQVVATNAAGPFQIGSVTLTRLAEDLVVLKQGGEALMLCRAPRDLNFCDEADIARAPGGLRDAG